jgi:Xaa-Pro aminopeptidase
MNVKIISQVQQILKEQGLGGWLIYDFQKRNTLAVQFLKLSQNSHLTRRFFYFIPQQGDPVKIVHAIEPNFLDEWPGKKKEYVSWKNLLDQLSSTLSGTKDVAMEFSPFGMIPYVSFLDVGMADLIRSFGVEIKTSSGFIQNFTCVLSDFQKETHFQAAKTLDAIASETWGFIAQQLQKCNQISEYNVQQFIKDRYHHYDCYSDADPICAVNVNSCNPHYSPSSSLSEKICLGDFIQIDLWCKKNLAGSVYADISRVAVASNVAQKKHQDIFLIVQQAQKEATEYVQKNWLTGGQLRGCDVDMVARNVIKSAGFENFFPHRTGHNIFTDDHGPGTHLDSIESIDERPLIAGTLFSIEPGIYLPGEFGVRLEYDVYLSRDKKIIVSGGIQDHIECLIKK